MKPIVLATDGSPSAAEATLEAVELAKAFDAPLVAVAVEHADAPGLRLLRLRRSRRGARKVEASTCDETLAQAKAVAAEAGVSCEARARHRSGRRGDLPPGAHERKAR